MKVICKCRPKLIVRYVGPAMGLMPYLKTWRESWRMEEPPQAYLPLSFEGGPEYKTGDPLIDNEIY